VIVLLARPVVDSADHLRKELPVQIGQQDAQSARAGHNQASRRAVWHVAQLACHIQDALPRIVSDRTTVVHHTGHRRDRYAGASGHFFYR
jgi:hypothetical protein